MFGCAGEEPAQDIKVLGIGQYSQIVHSEAFSNLVDRAPTIRMRDDDDREENGLEGFQAHSLLEEVRLFDKHVQVFGVDVDVATRIGAFVFNDFKYVIEGFGKILFHVQVVVCLRFVLDKVSVMVG